MKVGINGFGRIGRLVFRALWGRPGLTIVHVNDCGGDAMTAAHQLAFDSVHGRWPQAVQGNSRGFFVGTTPISYSQERDPVAVPWREAGVDLVLECSGRFKTPETLQPYFDAVGVKRVLVACPVKGEVAGAEALNVVFGINHLDYNPEVHRLVTAASCTTNCLAPVVKVVHESLGIRHGQITTIHDPTNTNVVVDAPHKDLRRARSAMLSLAPTTTGSATAIALIYPELKGKLDGHAVRAPVLNASLTDCVFELQRATSATEVNELFAAAAAGPLAGILGFETRPLVSADYARDTRSSIVDAPSTLVTDGTLLKVYAWYDNEMGYACRMVDLACRMRDLGV